MFEDPGDEYYYVDEQGNLIEPGLDQDRRGPAFPVEGEEPAPAGPRTAPAPRGAGTGEGGDAPQAASDAFLERAIGGPPPGE